MKIKTSHLIAFVLLAGIVTLFVLGYKSPPEKLKATDISIIESLSHNNQRIIELSTNEIEYWKELEFTITELEYPGETPDFVINLFTGKSEFTAMYNKGDEIIFFSFIPEIKYGFLNSPPPGGWIPPLYITKATDEILELLKIETK